MSMYQETSASLVDCCRKADAKNTMLVISLKREIDQAYQSMKFRLRELDFEKKQFSKSRNASERTANATLRAPSTTETKLSSHPLDRKTFSDEWVVDLKRRSTNERRRGLDVVRNAHAPTVANSRITKTPQCNDANGEFVLPTIVVDDRERCDPPLDAFLTEMRYDATRGPDVDMALLNVNVSSSGNTGRRGGPRIRRMSLPSIQPDTDSLKTHRSKAAIDGPILSVSGRTRRRSSVGLSMSMSMTKVIRDLNNGILSPELEEKRGTVVSDEEWETLRHCRYLRTPESP